MIDILYEWIELIKFVTIDSDKFWKTFWWIYCFLFIGSLLIATLGKKFGLRNKYIALLDQIFSFAATKIEDKDVSNTEEDEMAETEEE